MHQTGRISVGVLNWVVTGEVLDWGYLIGVVEVLDWGINGNVLN